MFFHRSPRPRLGCRFPFRGLDSKHGTTSVTERCVLATALTLASPGLTQSPLSPYLNDTLRGWRKKALLIGIKYKPRRGDTDPKFGELKYTHKDIRAMEKMLQEHSFKCKVMLDTRDQPENLKPRLYNILWELNELIQGSKAGDRLVVVLSGHGTQIPTPGSDEEDGQDEYFVPMDWEHWGHIRDNLLNRLLVAKLPPGVKLLVIVDACHSGTILDLRNNWTIEGGNIFGPSIFPPLSPAEFVMEKLGFSAQQAPGSQVLCMSAAMDAKKAYEQKDLSFIRFLLQAYGNNIEITIGGLFHSIDEELRRQLYARLEDKEEMQQPQISSNDPYLDLTAPFSDFL